MSCAATVSMRLAGMMSPGKGLAGDDLVSLAVGGDLGGGGVVDRDAVLGEVAGFFEVGGGAAAF
jgi:hypothetical protein